MIPRLILGAQDDCRPSRKPRHTCFGRNWLKSEIFSFTASQSLNHDWPGTTCRTTWLQKFLINNRRFVHKTVSTTLKIVPETFQDKSTVETWVTVEIRRRWDIGSMTLKKSTEISDFCKRLRVTDLNIFQSIFVVWGQMRTLCAPPGHPAANALQTRRYYGL